MMDAFCKDIQFALRRLRKNPLFTLAAVLPMALGIGVNTAMFTVGDALLRKALVIPDIARLAAIVETPPEKKSATSFATPADYLDLKRQNKSFERIGAYQYEDRVFTRGDSQVRVVAAAVSSDFFSVLGLLPAIGRTLPGVPHLPSVRIGRRVLFRRESLEQWLEEVEAGVPRRSGG
jgi:putative ABC transport system permease protein